ncbi:hypothetical protein DL763_010153 [Monosporascus cannonballus]|nr:hypothetical protein DL763_010153 [Monosporascus cannonballus]
MQKVDSSGGSPTLLLSHRTITTLDRDLGSRGVKGDVLCVDKIYVIQKMEYKIPVPSGPKFAPRLIIHGGAGNIPPRDKMPAKTYAAYREALLTIVSKTDTYMRTPLASQPPYSPTGRRYPAALDVATYAVTLLENDPLFNAGHGAVFTRDGINELEASVMVSRPSSHAKRGVGVMGLRRVKHPIQLARAVLEHGDADLGGGSNADTAEEAGGEGQEGEGEGLDVPSAQGHTLIHGPTAEALARKYGLELVDPGYFFTQRRWDEHVRALERERSGKAATASWSAAEFLPQGTVGAVALDEDGVLCVATSTGGMTNKLTGRIGDTPVVGAGFWAEEWVDDDNAPPPPPPHHRRQQWPSNSWQGARDYLGNYTSGPTIELSSGLRSFLADCLPTPLLYAPVALRQDCDGRPPLITTTRAAAVSGTGNGDSFLRLAAARTVAAMARWSPGLSAAQALSRVAGPGGELQGSAGERWGRTGEGEGGMIGIETVVARDAACGGIVVEARAVVLQDHNSSGMFRAWIDDGGVARFKIWRDE